MEQTKEGEFRRVLGPWSASALITGAIIGTGIFLFVSDVARQLPSRPSILAAWIVGAIVASCGALCLAELAAAYPKTGGIYIFLRRAYGPSTSFLYSWAKFLIMRPGTLAIQILAFATWSMGFLGLEEAEYPWMRKTLAIGTVVFLTAINTIGVRSGGWLQTALTIIKVLCLVAIVVIGASFGLKLIEAHPSAVDSVGSAQGNMVYLFVLALIPVLWSFGGWDESPFVAEEVTNPQRNLPLSIVGGLGIVAVLYVLVNAAYLAILTPGELAGSGGNTALIAMERALGGGGRKLIALALMICTFGAANGYALTGGRIAYATGKDQALFRWFGHVNPKTKTPVRGLVVQAVLTTATILIFTVPFKLLLYTGLAYWVFSGMTTAAVFVMRKRDPQAERPFRVWGYPFVPIISIAASVGMAVSVVLTDRPNALMTLGIMVVGGAVYVVQLVVFGK
ncbi:MAG: APC family permease [Planctomycetota bacterium]|jgi:amino acid transporter